MVTYDPRPIGTAHIQKRKKWDYQASEAKHDLHRHRWRQLLYLRGAGQKPQLKSYLQEFTPHSPKDMESPYTLSTAPATEIDQVHSVMETHTTYNEPEQVSFATEMAAEEESYAALMAQAKISLARITELGVEIDRVRESQNTGETRTAELLSRIESFGGSIQGGRPVEGEDHTMEGNDQAEGRGRIEEEYHIAEEEDSRMEVDMVVTEERGFPELMERAKKLLARITMDGNDQTTGDEVEAQARHDRAYADLWNPM